MTIKKNIYFFCRNFFSEKKIWWAGAFFSSREKKYPLKPNKKIFFWKKKSRVTAVILFSELKFFSWNNFLLKIIAKKSKKAGREGIIVPFSCFFRIFCASEKKRARFFSNEAIKIFFPRAAGKFFSEKHFYFDLSR